MRPRVKPALRRIVRDEHTLQFGVHPLRAVMLSGLTRPVRAWIESLDGTRDLERVLREAARAGLEEDRARSLLDQLTLQGALHDASAGPGALRDLPLAERDRLRPDLDALDLASTSPEGGIAVLERRRDKRVRVYGAGRVGAQVVALLAGAGVGTVRVFDPGVVRPGDITPGGLTWAELGLTREAGAVTVARRLTSGGRTPPVPAPAPPSETPSATAHRRSSSTTWGQGSREAGPSVAPAPSAPAARSRPVVPSSPAPGTTRPSRAVPDADRPRRRSPNGGRPSQPDHDAESDRPSRSLGVAAPSSGSRSESPASVGGRGVRRPPARDAGPRPARAGSPGQGEVAPSVNALAGGPYLGDTTDRPDLVVLAPVGPLDGVLVNELTALRIPHLLVSAFEGHGIVGPLVLPGESACLHCLDLTRRDHDPAWPIVTARLGGYPPGEIACDSTLAALVAAAATGHALAHLDGRESAVTNGTMDVTPDWRWKRRSWTIHPQCRCMRNNPYSLRMVMA
ncbi:thiamine biosynthesis protein ThiF [Nonomuraea sp. B5E05]|uniref:thiamine biosynthesis protein ThiF n=1 Tax=Nonomuraea sp. B5E05 TaxID=3153569 RepID=UPI0032614CFC